MDRGDFVFSASQASSEELLTLAVTAAAAIAKRGSAEETARLAAFFTVLGDTLALLALEGKGLEKGQGCDK